MKKTILMFKHLPGVFVEALELRKNPLLADIYEDVEQLRLGTFESRSYYMGPECDVENRRKDRKNMALDFGRAFHAAKLRLEK